jgi:hypothetical protein
MSGLSLNFSWKKKRDKHSPWPGVTKQHLFFCASEHPGVYTTGKMSQLPLLY